MFANRLWWGPQHLRSCQVGWWLALKNNKRNSLVTSKHEEVSRVNWATDDGFRDSVIRKKTLKTSLKCLKVLL